MKIRTLLVIAFAATLILSGSTASPQSRDDGINLCKEAMELAKKAQSPHDLKQAVAKYEEAFEIFNRSKFLEGLTTAGEPLCGLYLRLGENKKAVEFARKFVRVAEKSGDLKTQVAALNSLGTTYGKDGRYAQAVTCFNRALDLAAKLGDLRAEMTVRRNLGMVLREDGRVRESSEYYRRALEIARGLDDYGEQAQILNALGLLYCHGGQYTKGAERFEEALTVARKSGDKELEINPLMNLGNVYQTWGRYSEAVKYFQRSLDLARKVDDRSAEEQTLNNLGIVHVFQGHYGKGEDFFEQALKVAELSGGLKGQIDPINNIGNIYRHLGQQSKASDYYEKALKIALQIDDLRAQARSLNNLGTLNADSGHYFKAVEYFRKSLDIAEKLGDLKTESECLNNLGIIHAKWGQYGKAVDYLEKDLANARMINNERGQAMTLANLGSLYGRWGDYGQASSHYEKSLFLSEKLADKRSQAATLINLGRIQAYRHDDAKALESFRGALSICDRIGIPNRSPKDEIGCLYLDMGKISQAEPFIKEGGYLSSLGRLYLLKLDYETARYYYERLLREAETNRDADALFTANTGLGAAFEGTKDDLRAAQYYDKAVQNLEKLRSRLTADQKQRFFDVRVNGFMRTAPYEGLARVLLRMNRDEEALKSSEYTKARVFSEAMSRWTGASAYGVPAEVMREGRELSDQLEALEERTRAAYAKGEEQVIRTLEPRITELERKFETHIKTVRSQYPLFAASYYPRPLDLKDAALKENEWVLIYDVTDSGTIIYLTKGKKLIKALFKACPRKELDELVRQFREPLSMTGTEDIIEKLNSFDFASGKRLSDLLLADVLTDIPKGAPIVIAPDDSLGALPFEALVLNNGGRVVTDDTIPYVSGAEFFGDRNPITYYQSLTALTLARTGRKKEDSSNRLLVVADPVLESADARAAHESAKNAKPATAESRMYRDLMSQAATSAAARMIFVRLPLTGKLAAGLADIYPERSDIITGTDANKEDFLNSVVPNLAQYRDIVFATHGYFGKDLPGIMEPVLVLTLVPPGTDGFLRMSEVMDLRMNAQLVALIACQSGLGQHIPGEGTMGMGRAFQYAGAKSVLMSLWSIAEEPSVKLIESLFRHLDGGSGKLEALQLARKEIRNSGYDHPFFWAAFILVGETQ